MALTSSPTRYRLALAVIVVVCVAQMAWTGAPGAIALLFAVVFALSVQDRLRHSVVVLAREGDELVGTAVRGDPLRASETTFAVEPDLQGGWLIVLRAPGRSVRISPGGLGLTKTAAEQALLAMGLTRHDRPAT